MSDVLLYALCLPLAYWAIASATGLIFSTLPLIPKYIIRRDFSALIILVPLSFLYSVFIYWVYFHVDIADKIKRTSY